MKRLGIDFGSSYIKCANADSEQLIVLNKKPGGESECKIENSITYRKGDEPKLGTRLYRNSGEIYATVNNIKLFLSDKNWKCDVCDKILTPSDVTNDIMKCLYDIIHLQNPRESEYSATITIPVCFSERQREIIRLAAESAGFKVDSMISEPFASLFYLMRDNMDINHNVLIIDIGGGTLDVCLVKIENNKGITRVTTESSGGINFGGIIINQYIIDEILLPKYGEKLSKAIGVEENVRRYNLAKLSYDIDSLKNELFNEDYDEDEIDKPCPLPFATWDTIVDMDLSVSEIYGMFDRLLINKRITGLLDSVIEDSTIIQEDVTDVFLTGGTSLIPYFRKTIEKYFEDNGVSDYSDLFRLNDDLDIEEQAVGSVALGAGIYNVLTSEDRENMEIRNKIPFKIFSKDSEDNHSTLLMADCTYKSYHSQFGVLNDVHKGNGRVDIFQQIYDESKTVIYIGYIPLTDRIISDYPIYRLGIDTDRQIYAEFGVVEGDKRNAEFKSCAGKQYMKIDV